MIPTEEVEAQARQILEAWRYSPEYTGGCICPRAHWYLDGRCEAVILFSGDVPLDKAIYDVTGSLAPLGDGIVVFSETWLRSAEPGSDFHREVLEDPDGINLSGDPEAGEAMMIMFIGPDGIASTSLAFSTNDEGLIVWDVPHRMGNNFSGRMSEVAQVAMEKGALLHEKLRETFDLVKAIDIGDGDEIGMGPVYRGVFGALGGMDTYLLLVSEDIMVMA